MRLIDLIIRIVPFKYKLCSWAALSPTRFRKYLSYRLFSKLAYALQKSNANLHLMSNLGISDSLRVKMPIHAHPFFLFGRPCDYRGERSVLYLARQLAPDCDAIADIGANWGYHTFFLAVAAPSLDIYSFEPNAALSLHVEENAASNHLTRVHCLNEAIADKSGEISFYLNSSDDLSSSLSDVFLQAGHEVQLTTVKAQSFDDFGAQHSYQRWLLKVDVESAEFQFLDGAMESMAQGKIRYLIIELLASARAGGFVERMLELGYCAYYLNDLSIEQMHRDDGRSMPSEYNWLFCKDSPQQLAKRLQGSEFQLKT